MKADLALPRVDGAPWAARVVLRLLAGLEHGRLVLHTPDGLRWRFAGSRPGPAAELVVGDWGAFATMARRAEIGVFECWRDGRIATPDMTAFLELAAANHAALAGVFRGNAVFAALLRAAHLLRPNTRGGARRNIHAHYDLGNDFYALWLDPTMTYSSALFTAAGQGLADAQLAKYDRLLDALAPEPGQHVLEVGCGWGGFAERAAATRGVRVTGLTISREQLAYARGRVAAAGLAGRVAIEFCDYRDAAGTYDRVASIEMVEAVGERYWPRYFRMLAARLARGGRAALQSIVIDEDAFAGYRASSDFIREHVFPGGMLPTVSRIAAHARAAGLEPVGEPFRFGRDYAETLARWRAAFDAREAEVRAMGFDADFLATWRFYLHYCEAGFRAGRVDVVQMAFARP